MWALIIGGIVRETTKINPTGRFHPSLKWVKCDESVTEGMLYDGKKFTEAETE